MSPGIPPLPHGTRLGSPGPAVILDGPVAECLPSLIAHMPVAVAILDRDMRYLAASQRWRSGYHLGDQELIGRSHYEVFPEIPDRWRAVHRRCLAGAVESAQDEPFERADGTMDWVTWEARPWLDASGAIGGLMLFTEIVSERKRSEALDERYRMLARHSRDIMLFIRRADGRVLEANDAATVAYGYTHEELGALSIQDLRAPGTRSLTAGQIAQADSGGVLFETVHRRKDGSEFPVEVSSQGATVGGVRVLLSVVRDIADRHRPAAAPEDGLAHDFNNLLTAILGGVEALDDAVNQGLPVQREDVQSIQQAGERARELTRKLLSVAQRDEPVEKLETSPAGGSETVLLVEDEALVRDIMARALRKAGYRVLVASQASEALAATGEDAEHIDLLVTDIVMPGLGGPDLAERLLSRHPAMQVLFVSGYAQDAIGHAGVLRPGAEFLQKPFRMSALLTRVRGVLEGPGRRDH